MLIYFCLCIMHCFLWEWVIWCKLETPQAMPWWIFQTDCSLQETATNSLTVKWLFFQKEMYFPLTWHPRKQICQENWPCLFAYSRWRSSFENILDGFSSKKGFLLKRVWEAIRMHFFPFDFLLVVWYFYLRGPIGKFL